MRIFLEDLGHFEVFFPKVRLNSSTHLTLALFRSNVRNAAFLASTPLTLPKVKSADPTFLASTHLALRLEFQMCGLEPFLTRGF